MSTLQVVLQTLKQTVVALTLLSSVLGEDGGGGHCDREAGLCSPAGPRLVAVSPVRVDHIEEINVDPQRLLQRKTLSLKPALFEVENFLTTEECEYMRSLAIKTGLKQSVTYNNGGAFSGPVQVMDLDSNKKLDVSEMRLTLENSYDIYFSDEDVFKMYKTLNLDKNNDGFLTPHELGKINPDVLQNWLRTYTQENPAIRSRVSSQVWLYLDKVQDETVRHIQDRLSSSSLQDVSRVWRDGLLSGYGISPTKVVQRLTGLLPGIVAHSDVQVVRYPAGGHYHAHFDSAPITTDQPCCSRTIKRACRICRYMTVMFYLNNVKEGGGTAFPVADNSTVDTDKLRSEHLINLREHCHDANLVVTPSQGKAVMWYNHDIDPATSWMGPMDEHAWHGGCPVITGEKWIANFWIKTSENKEADIQRMNL